MIVLILSNFVGTPHWRARQGTHETDQIQVQPGFKIQNTSFPPCDWISVDTRKCFVKPQIWSFFMIHPISQTNALSRNQIIVNPTRSFLFMKAQGYSFKYLDKKEKSLKKNWVICIKWCNAKPQDVLLWMFLDNLYLGFKSTF